MHRRTPKSTRTDTLFHYTTLVRTCLRARAHPALLARSMVEMDGSRIRASRRAVTTPIAIVIPLSVAHAVFAAASIMKGMRSEEHTSELQSLMSISYAVFCLKKKNKSH